MEWTARRSIGPPKEYTALVGPYMLEVKRTSTIYCAPAWQAELVSAGVKYPLFWRIPGDPEYAMSEAERRAKEVLRKFSDDALSTLAQLEAE